jgi:hypothetical protein
MSRKHFKLIAEILRNHKADPVLIRDMAQFCYDQNGNFDRARFYEACGLTDL